MHATNRRQDQIASFSFAALTLPHQSAKNKRWQKHGAATQRNQAKLCDHRQICNFMFPCQNEE